MPQIVLNVSEPVDLILQARAAEAGCSVEDYLLKVAQESPNERVGSQLTFEEWERNSLALREYLATIPSLRLAKVVDDRRESIY